MDSVLDTTHKNKEMGTFPEVTGLAVKGLLFLMCELLGISPMPDLAPNHSSSLSKALLGEENLGLVGTGSRH